MIKPEEIMRGLWTFPIVLPDNPLKWLNCYVIKGENGGRNLIIDSGFKRPECLEALKEGMDALGIRADETDVFFTHMHSDHTGNAGSLQAMGCRILMGSLDYSLILREAREHQGKIKDRALHEGMSRKMYDLIFDHNPAILYRTEVFDAISLDEGETITYGDYTLSCVLTPGHTPGHMCLYDRGKKILFLGDHVLFDITPNITAWPVMDDALGTYLDSLKKLKELDVELALPAHRNTGAVTLYQRIDELLEHHKRRLEETQHIVEQDGPIDAYSISGRMSWRIQAKSWDEFPLGQKWFAFGETEAHLDYLVKRRRIEREEDCEGNVKYFCR